MRQLELAVAVTEALAPHGLKPGWSALRRRPLPAATLAGQVRRARLAATVIAEVRAVVGRMTPRETEIVGRLAEGALAGR